MGVMSHFKGGFEGSRWALFESNRKVTPESTPTWHIPRSNWLPRLTVPLFGTGHLTPQSSQGRTQLMSCEVGALKLWGTCTWKTQIGSALEESPFGKSSPRCRFHVGARSRSLFALRLKKHQQTLWAYGSPLRFPDEAFAVGCVSTGVRFRSVWLKADGTAFSLVRSS